MRSKNQTVRDYSFRKARANLYSLIEPAKANGIEPYAYLKMLFSELPRASTVGEAEALMPTTAMGDKRQAA